MLHDADATPARPWFRWVWGGLLLAVLAVAAIQIARYGGYYYDDAFISLRYSRRLLEGKGLTWTDGEWVEGYSNFLWVVLCAALRPLGLRWVTTTHVLGGLGMALVVVGASIDPLRPWRPNLVRVAFGGMITWLTGALVIWASAGLEQTLLAGFVTAGSVAIVRGLHTSEPAPRWVAAGLFALAVLTRADAAGLWLATMAGLGLLYIIDAERRPAIRALWPVLVLPALAAIGQQIFRLVYYDDWIPNTARAKVSFTWARAQRGLEYVGEGLLRHGVFVIGAMAALARAPWSRVLVPAVTCVLWSGYIAFVGGDFMAGWRFLVPIFGLLAWLTAEAATTIPQVSAARLVVPIWLVHAYGANTGRLIDKAFDREGWTAGPPVGRTLRRAFGHADPLFAMDAAGALAFYSELRSLDLLGLNDRWLAHHPPPQFGGRALGHDLGNADYVWSRKPDLMLFNGTNGTTRPRYISARGMLRHAEFDDFYQYVNLKVQVRRRWWSVHLFLRREDGPLGVVRTPDAIAVPGYLLARHKGAPAYLRGRTVLTRIEPNNPGELFRIAVPAGRWTVEVADDIQARFRCRGVTTDQVLPAPTERDVIELDQRTSLDVVLRPAERRTFVEGLRIVRTDEAVTVQCSQGPLQRTASDFATVMESGTSRRVRGVTMFDQRGLAIALDDSLQNPASIELGLADGLGYMVEWRRKDEVLARRQVKAEPLGKHERGDLTLHRLAVAPEDLGEGADTLFIRPRGKGTGAIGHLRAIDEVQP
ncbi:MAG: hypothetical protein AAGA48_10190 [Myxococcota bacterium]